MRLPAFAVPFFCLILLSGIMLHPVNADEDALEAHKAVVQQVYDEVLNQGNFAVMETLYAPEYVNHGFGDDLTMTDYQAYIETMRAALPDFEAKVEVLIAEDDRAASRVLFSGTFEQPWVMGEQTLEPNGKTVTWTANIVHYFDENDQIVEDFTAFDLLSLLIQLDAAPLPKLFATLLKPGEYHPAVMGENTSNDMNDVHVDAFMHIMDDAINNGDLTAIETYMAEDHRAHEPFGEFSREQFAQVIAGFRTLVPDLVVTVDGMVVEGDWLAARLTYAGTFSKELTNGLITIKPTNKPIKFIVNVFVRYNEDGVSIEDFKEYNRLGWLRQIELLPAAS